MNGPVCNSCAATLTGRYCANCGTPANARKRKDAVADHRIASNEDIIKLIGAEQFLLVLKNAFRPIEHIRQVGSATNFRLSAFLLSYIEFGAIIKLFNEYVLKAAVANLRYPWAFQDRTADAGLLSILIASILSGLALFVVCLLPRQIFHPKGKIEVLSLLFVVSMYVDLYYTLTSTVFIVYWSVAGDAQTLAVISFLRTVAIQAFALCAIRFGLGLSWLAAVILFALSLVTMAVTALAFFATGVWRFA
jgi:hypothetical protein